VSWSRTQKHKKVKLAVLGTEPKWKALACDGAAIKQCAEAVNKAAASRSSCKFFRSGLFAPNLATWRTAVLPAGWAWLAQLPLTDEQEALHILSFNVCGLQQQPHLPQLVTMVREHIARLHHTSSDCPLPDVIIIQNAQASEHDAVRVDTIMPAYSAVLVQRLQGKGGIAVFVRNELAQWRDTAVESVPEDSEGRALVLTIGTTAIVAVHYATQAQVPSMVQFNAQLKQRLLRKRHCADW
jgi:hypothetical protein